MTTMVELHASHFDEAQGCFNDKPWAGLAAEQIRRFLHANGFEDSRYVQVEGKHTFVIQFPRIRHVWWPRPATGPGIAAEMEAVLKLFKEAFRVD